MQTVPQNKEKFTINNLLYCCEALIFTHPLVCKFLCGLIFMGHPVIEKILFSFTLFTIKVGTQGIEFKDSSE